MADLSAKVVLLTTTHPTALPPPDPFPSIVPLFQPLVSAPPLSVPSILPNFLRVYLFPAPSNLRLSHRSPLNQPSFFPFLSPFLPPFFFFCARAPRGSDRPRKISGCLGLELGLDRAERDHEKDKCNVSH